MQWSTKHFSQRMAAPPPRSGQGSQHWLLSLPESSLRPHPSLLICSKIFSWTVTAPHTNTHTSGHAFQSEMPSLPLSPHPVEVLSSRALSSVITYPTCFCSPRGSIPKELRLLWQSCYCLSWPMAAFPALHPELGLQQAINKHLLHKQIISKKLANCRPPHPDYKLFEDRKHFVPRYGIITVTNINWAYHVPGTLLNAMWTMSFNFSQVHMNYMWLFSFCDKATESNGVFGRLRNLLKFLILVK